MKRVLVLFQIVCIFSTAILAGRVATKKKRHLSFTPRRKYKSIQFDFF
jgi:hypothetical protein